MIKIVLLGYMGSGKSTIAHLLSEKTQIEAFDLDEIIEERAGLSIKNIFEQKGEVFFRKLENQIFKELISSEKEMILSLGGGTPCYANNHELLNGDGVVSFYLKASIETLYGRLLSVRDNRPLIAEQEEEEMKEYIAKHLFDRSYYYNQATHIVSVDGKSPEEVSAEIKRILA
ncbi:MULTISPECIES: shikimate kinase [Flavobacterium]|jgi:shikimate kinase|uniref:shikimate kinase n=1 Tax=Flavobacterium TaxID=237 RepID=UPI000961C075|nr:MULTISPECIES: shikimate kinase [Flavobacterium]MBL7866463.1 AAA family ATPase [Flavobacterium lindanitolerans]MDQ7961995.1 shikimate kinase [Flavobacterium lindanitolerans]OJX55689.1 MAG: shikimate kinase [Flavobacterium sp. 38-13]